MFVVMLIDGAVVKTADVVCCFKRNSVITGVVAENTRPLSWLSISYLTVTG